MAIPPSNLLATELDFIHLVQSSCILPEKPKLSPECDSFSVKTNHGNSIALTNKWFRNGYEKQCWPGGYEGANGKHPCTHKKTRAQWMLGVAPRVLFRTEELIPTASRRVISKVMPSRLGQPTSSDWLMQRHRGLDSCLNLGTEFPVRVSRGPCCNSVLADSSLWPILPVTPQ